MLRWGTSLEKRKTRLATGKTKTFSMPSIPQLGKERQTFDEWLFSDDAERVTCKAMFGITAIGLMHIMVHVFKTLI